MVRGCAAYTDDTWRSISIGSSEFDLVKVCVCVCVCVCVRSQLAMLVGLFSMHNDYD